MRTRAYTLIEIMIVIFIIGLLLMVAAPQFLRARQQAHQRSCMSNLRQINDAKDILASDTNLPDGAVIAPADIFPQYLKMPSFPTCPGGGTYTLHPIGQRATCTVTSGPFPHLAP
ncbi:MAG TPA: prepilin-type N-terminal cleavage/methylation domain-containing protein [Fimbriimonadaceae bacterium]|nr:prepilin-type N-terminal cleavage/methylation domain-containing protein [Fimbriimonadaceae bacterium]